MPGSNSAARILAVTSLPIDSNRRRSSPCESVLNQSTLEIFSSPRTDDKLRAGTVTFLSTVKRSLNAHFANLSGRGSKTLEQKGDRVRLNSILSSAGGLSVTRQLNTYSFLYDADS